MARNYVWVAMVLAISYQMYTTEKYRDYIDKILNGEFDFLFEPHPENGDPLFTADQLKKYNNVENGLYLSIVGNVFDVTKGAKHYGPGETYHHFTGRDASQAFITGDSEEKSLSDDISNLSNSQLKSIQNWVKFYNENYIYKGKLIGRYFNKNGHPTEDYKKYENRLKLAEEEQSTEDAKLKHFPPCNIEWKADVGSRVWCTKQSGGISRDWVGVPRQYFESPDAGQSRCACVKLDSPLYKENEKKLREYDGCLRESDSCIVPSSA